MKPYIITFFVSVLVTMFILVACQPMIPEVTTSNPNVTLPSNQSLGSIERIVDDEYGIVCYFHKSHNISESLSCVKK